MIRRILQKLANPRGLFVLFVLYLLFNLVLFPLAGNMGGQKAGRALDLHFIYSPEQAHENIAMHTDAERRVSIVGHLTVDTVYPFVYTFLLAALILFLLRPLAGVRAGVQKLVYLPFAILVADFLENAGIVAMLARYPKWSPALAQVTGMMTTVKWSLVALTLTLVLVLLVFRLLRRGKKA